jgi:hypothetical protein
VNRIRLLRYRDRAALRILDRAEAATPRQLAILVYGHRRIAQRQLRLLWQAGLLERTILPPETKGGAEAAYRLSGGARRRLGDRSHRIRGSNRLRHTLDIVETVCALVTANGEPRTSSPVARWLPERMARAQVGGPPFPDSILLLNDRGRSATISLEVDEETQRRMVIEEKLAGYRRILAADPGWTILFVVPSNARASWLRLVAGSVDEAVAQRTWVTTLPNLRERHLAAALASMNPGRDQIELRDLLTPSSLSPSRHPVAGDAWLRLLVEGGVEDSLELDPRAAAPCVLPPDLSGATSD